MVEEVSKIHPYVYCLLCSLLNVENTDLMVYKGEK